MNPRHRTAAIAALVAVVALVVVVVLVLDDDDGGDRGSLAGRQDTGEVDSGAEPEPFRYPRTVRGGVGEAVALLNEDDAVHTFTSDTGLFDSGPVEPAGVFTVATLPAGEYGFHCSIHPDLAGTLTIEG